ncbi:MAG: ankyrin repeat domain-containing protein [Deltaproteobacteria bacterium]|nr:ankyrin repeat domain-containing protein [Deltaproteobacteria bacterium]
MAKKLADKIRDKIYSKDPVRIAEGLEMLKTRLLKRTLKPFSLRPFGVELLEPFGQDLPADVQLAYMWVVDLFPSFEPRMDPLFRMQNLFALALEHGDQDLVFHACRFLRTEKDAAVASEMIDWLFSWKLRPEGKARAAMLGVMRNLVSISSPVRHLFTARLRESRHGAAWQTVLADLTPSLLVGAVHDQDSETAAGLLESGLDVADLWEDSSYHVLHRAILNRDTPCTELLLDHGAPLEVRTRLDGGDYPRFTPLHMAARLGDRRLCQLLLDRGADVHQESQGQSSLHHACMGGDLQLVERLLGQGLDVDRRGPSGSTPLHAAALNEHSHIVRCLLANAAQVGPVDGRGIGAWMCTAGSSPC